MKVVTLSFSDSSVMFISVKDLIDAQLGGGGRKVHIFVCMLDCVCEMETSNLIKFGSQEPTVLN